MSAKNLAAVISHCYGYNNKARFSLNICLTTKAALIIGSLKNKFNQSQNGPPSYSDLLLSKRIEYLMGNHGSTKEESSKSTFITKVDSTQNLQWSCPFNSVRSSSHMKINVAFFRQKYPCHNNGQDNKLVKPFISTVLYFLMFYLKLREPE